MEKFKLFPSPHSGILFLSKLRLALVGPSGGFRPLIRGFFFYSMEMKLKDVEVEGGFRPLIRGFFFYPVVMICRQV